MNQRQPPNGRRVVFLVPPFYTLMGSEHRKVPAGGHLDVGIVKAAGYDVRLVHADAPHTLPRKLAWRDLYARSDLCLNGTYLLDQLAISWPRIEERLRAFEPDVVVVLAGGWAEPAKDVADVQVSVQVGRLLADAGIDAVCAGALPSRFPQLFASAFRATIAGPPNDMLLDAVEGRTGIISRARSTLGRQVEGHACDSDTDVRWPIATMLGCSHQCVGCPMGASNQATLARDAATLARELRALPDGPVDIFDTCFGEDSAHLSAILPTLQDSKRSFTVTTRTDVAFFPEMFKLWRHGPFRTVKLGIESFADSKLLAMKPDAMPTSEVLRGLDRLHSTQVDVFAYLLVGGHGETNQTLEQTLKVAQRTDCVDFWLPNIFSPLQDPVAHHFSRPQARKLGLDMNLVDAVMQRK